MVFGAIAGGLGIAGAFADYFGQQKAQSFNERVYSDARSLYENLLLPQIDPSFAKIAQLLSQGYDASRGELDTAGDLTRGVTRGLEKDASRAFQTGLSSVTGGAINSGLLGSTVQSAAAQGTSGAYVDALTNIRSNLAQSLVGIQQQKAGLEERRGSALAGTEQGRLGFLANQYVLPYANLLQGFQGISSGGGLGGLGQLLGQLSGGGQQQQQQGTLGSQAGQLLGAF